MVFLGENLHPQDKRSIEALSPKEKTTEMVFMLTTRKGKSVDLDSALKQLQGWINHFGYEGKIQLRKRGEYLVVYDPDSKKDFPVGVWEMTKSMIMIAGYKYSVVPA